MTVYDVSRKLGEIGWPIVASGITRIELGQRRVDADDLVALAVALGCSPLRLILPASASAEACPAVTPLTAAPPADLWAWAAGERPLALNGDAPMSGSALAMWIVENRPDRAADFVAAIAGRG
jgi:hypothetical protein